MPSALSPFSSLLYVPSKFFFLTSLTRKSGCCGVSELPQRTSYVFVCPLFFLRLSLASSILPPASSSAALSHILPFFPSFLFSLPLFSRVFFKSSADSLLLLFRPSLFKPFPGSCSSLTVTPAAIYDYDIYFLHHRLGNAGA